MENVKTVAFKRFEGGEVLAHIYLPKQPRPPMPVCFYFHGGSWEKGSPDEAVTFFPVVAKGLRERGVAVVSVEYRLAPSAYSIARCVEDCADALRFFALHADNYGFDASRYAVGGYSAGGHLALMTALAGERFPGAEELAGVKYSLRCVVNLCGPTDFMILGRAAFAKNPEKARQSLKRLAVECGDGLAEMEKLSPLSYIKRGALPGVLTVHGELDNTVSREHHSELVRRYEENGGKIEFIEVKNAGHGLAPTEAGPEPRPKKEELEGIIVDFIGRNMA